MKAITSPQRLRQPHLARLFDKLNQEPPSGAQVTHTRSLIGALLQDAVREAASDVHLDPVSGGYLLRFRIDGALIDTILLERKDGLRLVHSFKSHAGLEPAYTRLPQDGRAEFQVGDQVYSVRVATAPSVLGEKLALRFLPNELARLNLKQLGLSDADYAQVTRALKDARGMILISGPTGSGKTTTAYALLHELKRANRAIVTIEDPVEYAIEGITQIQVNEKAGLTFAKGVKGLLRLDPDIIMMGEMRDSASARAALDAADSGHVFLSTLHARDAAGTITALRNFGLADHEIAATVDLVAAQRLVRRLCPACRKQEPPTDAETTWLGYYRQPVPKLTWHAVGCPQCSQTGYRGRIGIFEVWRMNEEFADLILNHTDERTLRQRLRRFGTLSLLEDDLQKVVQGVTTLEEIQNVGGLEFFLPGGGRKSSRTKAAANSASLAITE